MERYSPLCTFVDISTGSLIGIRNISVLSVYYLLSFKCFIWFCMAGFKPQGLVFSLDVFMPGLECVDAFIARSCASICLSSCKLGGGGEDREVWLSSLFSCLLPRHNRSIFITICYEPGSFIKCILNIGPQSLVIFRTIDISVFYHYVCTWTHVLICMYFHIEIEHLVAD